MDVIRRNGFHSKPSDRVHHLPHVVGRVVDHVDHDFQNGVGKPVSCGGEVFDFPGNILGIHLMDQTAPFPVYLGPHFQETRYIGGLHGGDGVAVYAP